MGKEELVLGLSPLTGNEEESPLSAIAGPRVAILPCDALIEALMVSPALQ